MFLEPIMHHLNTIAIPKLAAEWESVAYALRYGIPIVQRIRSNHHGDAKKCCNKLFEDWLSTGNGVEPKTWDTLLSKLKEIVELDAVTNEIKEKLIQIDYE